MPVLLPSYQNSSYIVFNYYKYFSEKDTKQWFVLAQKAPKLPQLFSGQNSQLSNPNIRFDSELGGGRGELIMNWALCKSHSLP